MARAFHRGYVTDGKRAGQVRRFHVIREKGPAGCRDGRQALCGTHAWPCQASDPVIFDPMPPVPPGGLSWCPSCIGHLAELQGVLGDVAARLAVAS